MDFLPWSEKYELKIDEIDSQHRVLFTLINQLYGQLMQLTPPLESQKILDELIRYTEIHFVYEETIFERLPMDKFDKDLHKLEHREFCKQIASYREKLNNGDANFIADMLGFLKDWLKEHILETDMIYKREYFKHGSNT